MSDQPPPLPERDWHEMRREERQRRRDVRWGQGGPWIGGLLLIALGPILLAQNFGYPVPKNWWAVFILIPAVAAFAGAWRVYRKAGRMTGAVVGAAVGGLILAFVALAFFYEIDFGKYWPVILILLGIAAISGAWRRGDGPPGERPN